MSDDFMRGIRGNRSIMRRITRRRLIQFFIRDHLSPRYV